MKLSQANTKTLKGAFSHLATEHCRLVGQLAEQMVDGTRPRQVLESALVELAEQSARLHRPKSHQQAARIVETIVSMALAAGRKGAAKGEVTP